MRKKWTYLILGIGVIVSCKKDRIPEPKVFWYGHEVTASAYNSVNWQTDDTPGIAAWGDTLRPGMKCIAVSRDLLRLGIGHNTMVRIENLPDTFYVKDKMHKRWRNRIDIYMGEDVRSARQWGKRKLQICYAIAKDSLTPIGKDQKVSLK